MPVRLCFFLPFLFAVLLGGCAIPSRSIDWTLAREARLAFRQERTSQRDRRLPDQPREDEEAPTKSVILAELLAIFPGIVWHGVGHQYAGDRKTARAIREAGGWGYLLMGIGGGLLVGGNALDDSTDLDGLAYSLYGTGGVTAGIGVGFFLTAWIYDIVDTPRAVRTGGKPPPPGSLFRDGFDGFGDF